MIKVILFLVMIDDVIANFDYRANSTVEIIKQNGETYKTTSSYLMLTNKSKMVIRLLLAIFPRIVLYLISWLYSSVLPKKIR